MLQDLHAHTYYSFCGQDAPQVIVEAAIAGGLEWFGITDHNYGVGHDPRALRRYFDHIDLIRERYADRIRVLRGLEVCTLKDETHPGISLPEDADISFFDYCLIENLEHPSSITGGDLFAFAKRCGTPVVGVAHTDLFGLVSRLQMDPLDYFGRMAEENIFWEMNVSYDSIHGYREHGYFLEFFNNPAQQDIIRRSGVRVSIGFDGHRVGDYLPERVVSYCQRLTELGIRMPFEPFAQGGDRCNHSPVHAEGFAADGIAIAMK